MTRRVLLVVDDSPAALAAARWAIDLAGSLGARLRVVDVIVDGMLTEVMAEISTHPELAGRRDAAARSVLEYVVRLARHAGVETETARTEGEPAGLVLAQARAWHADLIVIGRPNGPRVGEPGIEAGTARLLEFAEQPVVVVPRGRPAT